MSDFAYHKIKGLIALVENKDLSEQERQEYLKIADLIGDDIISFKINQILKND